MRLNVREKLDPSQLADVSGDLGPTRPGPLGWLPTVPLFFLGIGIYRAWIELVYVRPVVDFPTWAVAGHDVFDIAMVIVLLVSAYLSRKLVPLSQKRWAYLTTGALMVVGTVLSFWSIYDPSMAAWAAFPSAIAAGIGTAGIILLWSEFYGCLNPARVAFYYSLSLLFGALVVLLMKGFVLSYSAVLTTLLPIISLLCVAASFRALSPDERPKRSWGSFSFPWKPVALMSVYAFAYGLRESTLYTESGPHSSLGVVFAASVVALGVALRHERFNLTIIYRGGLPLMVGGLLIVPQFTPAGTFISNFCVSASYTAFSILIMLILSNISYRYGVGAVWLFGLERGLRALVMWLGRVTSELLAASTLSTSAQSTLVTAAVVVLVIASTMILLSEKELSSRWGVDFLGGTESDPQVAEKNRLADACERLATERNLSPREAEVLQLLARGKTIADIEHELFIARGTAKAHLGHIYQKLGIHTRGELNTMLQLETAE